MAKITNFRAPLRCPRCSHDGMAWLYSILGDRGATYSVGDCPGDDILPINFEEASFIVQSPAANGKIHMLMSWTCENCKCANFGEVVFEGGCIRSIDLVDLDPSTLTRLHYISADLEDRLETIIGEPLYDEAGLRSDWLTALRRALDAGKRW